MKAIIIDDEPIAREGVKILSNQIPNLEIIGEFGNPLVAQSFVSKTKDIDIIFLDVEMPGLTGIEYLKSMPPATQVILTTAYPQYALEAFELDVVDYLLKPIRLDRFAKAIQKVRDLKDLQNHDLEVNAKEDFIYIKSERKFIKLFLNDVLFIKGLKDYVIIHSATDKYLTAMNVGTIAKQLPSDRFVRVSKSYIINVNYISHIDVDLIDLNGHEIPLGKSYKEDFLTKYVKSNLLKR